MKVNKPCVFRLLIVGFALAQADRVTAQTFKTLYSFTALYIDPAGNDGGATPIAGLVSSGNILFGTAQTGGILNAGAVFAINADGTDFTNLHSFVKSVPSALMANTAPAFRMPPVCAVPNRMFPEETNPAMGVAPPSFPAGS